MSWDKIKLADVIEKPLSGEWGGEGDDIFVLRTTNFSNDGTLDLTSVVKRNIPLAKVNRKRLLFGDTILEKSGGSPSQPVGRVVFFNVESEEPYLCNNFTSLIRPKKTIDSKYLFWFLFNNHITKKTLQYQNKTTGIINLQTERYIDELLIPLPPLPTQKKIAAILDQADALRKKDQQLLAQYDALLQSIFYDMFGDPVRNEKGWDIQQLKTCVDRIQIGPFGTQLHMEDYIEGGIPLINPTHIVNGKIKEQLGLTVSNEKYRELKNYYLAEGDIIMGRRGEMGRCAIIGKRESGWICGTGSLFIRLDKKNHNSDFLQFVLTSRSIKKYLENSSLGVTMPNLNLNIVSGIPIINPPNDKQKRFETISNNVDSQKQQIKQQLQQSEALFQTLLQKAFNGELVP